MWRKFLSKKPTHVIGKCFYSQMKVYVSKSIDPFFNLGFEEYIFENEDPSINTLYLYRNDKAVIIGRNQNPWKECHIQNIEKDGVNVVRRKSGGGAVYQDVGNSIFSFLTPKKNVDVNNHILISALKKFPNLPPAAATGRNDITIDGRKISGSAFKQSRNRFMHHGTMLIDVKMDKMLNYLNPNKLKLKSKGVSSVAARVVNLKELDSSINHESFCEKVIETFCDFYQQKCDIEEIYEEKFKDNNILNSIVAQWRDWEWRFGQKTPDFTHNLETRFDWGTFDVHIDSKRGMVCKYNYLFTFID